MYDILIIGAGWAGFNAALRAKSQGKRVALVEESAIGGTCLNKGCIPTKTLIQSARVLEQTKKAKNFGIALGDVPQINIVEIQSRKTKIIQQLRVSMESRLAGIDRYIGTAQFVTPETIRVADQEIKTEKILLALGSRSLELKGFEFDGKKILSSDQILEIGRIPSSLLVIGGGVIGCEFAALFNAFGSKVTVVEMMAQLVPGLDQQIAKKLETIFKKRGITVLVKTDCHTLDRSLFDTILVCIGRQPRIDGLQSLGVATHKGHIAVNENLETSVPGVYAAGDCTGQPMLAHWAGYQGIIAAENMAAGGPLRKADAAFIPSCIYTHPEIATVGMTEDQARQKNISVRVYTFDFLGSGMARILEEAEGFIKIISDDKSQKLIGASIIGPKATELIGILTVALNGGFTIEQLRGVIFAHPTVSEAIGEALG